MMIRQLGEQAVTNSQKLKEKSVIDKRSTTSLKFPQDLDTIGHGNVIRFNINIPSGSKYLGNAEGSSFGVNPATGGSAKPRYMEANSTSLNKRFSDNSVRTDTVIDLYMPPQITMSYDATWNTTELGLAGAAAEAAMALGSLDGWEDAGNAWQGVKNTASESLKNTLAGMTQALTPLNTKDLKSMVTQSIAHPYMEVIFEGVTNRTFNFTFKMIPRNAQEQAMIKKITETLKFHRAPEVKYEDNNQYWLFPSTFDIMFLHKGQENPWISKISTCAMTNLTVDHSPEGQYSSHQDGSPFATTLTMSFVEMEVLTKERIAEGY